MTDPATYIQGRTVQEQMNSLIGYVDQRSAEVALDAIAADVAQVAADKADAHADALAAAASAAAAAGTLANAVTLTDAQTITGAKTFSVSPVVPTPTNNTDASTKKYVDDADASILAAINSLDAAVVKLTGNQTVGGTKTFSASPVGPTEATGTFSTKLATSDKVKNELDNYAAMVRTTGNQNISGIKTFTNNTGVTCKVSNFGTGVSMVQSTDDYTQPTDSELNYPYIDFRDGSNNQVAILRFNHTVNVKKLEMLIKDKNGTFHTTVLATWTDS